MNRFSLVNKLSALKDGAVFAALLAVALLPAHAQTGLPPIVSPPNPQYVLIGFPERDFFSGEGFQPNDFVKVDVIHPPTSRNTVKFFTTSPDAQLPTKRSQLPGNLLVPDLDGLVEVNHPGGGCWAGTTPDIAPGDRIVVTIYRAGGNSASPSPNDPVVAAERQEILIADVSAQRPLQTGAGQISVHGTAKDFSTGLQMPLGLIEQRLIGSSADRFDKNGRRDLRAPRDGLLTYDAPGSLAWTAVYNALSAADVSRALNAESRILWLGRAASEITIFENGAGIGPGPSAPCTAPAEIVPVVGDISPPNVPTGLAVTVGSGNNGVALGDIQLGWTSASDNGGGVTAGYGVYRKTSTGQILLTFNSIRTTFTDTNVPPGTYSYTVDAVDNAFPSPNRSAQSSSVSATIGAPPGTLPTPAQPPAAPRSITLFPSRDSVSAKGFVAGEQVSVRMLRSGVTLPISATNPVSPALDGSVNVNTVGGICWNGKTPRILPGDTVQTFTYEVDPISGNIAVKFIDQTVTPTLISGRPIQVGTTVIVHGIAKNPATGLPLALDRLEHRFVLASGAFSNGTRTLSAKSTAVDGIITIETANNPDGTRWTATYTNLSPADLALALGSESDIVWLGSNPTSATESSIVEVGSASAPVLHGPVQGCTAPAEAISGPRAKVNPTSIAFGNQLVSTSSAAQNVTLTNTGNSPLTITSVGVAQQNAGEFQITNTCSGAVPAAGTCNVSVTFTPAGSSGPRTASLVIGTDDPDMFEAVVLLSGTGTAPQASITPTSLTFATQFVGTTSAASTVTVSNTGTAPLTVTTAPPANTEFTVATSTCNNPVAASASCTISVTFAPTGTAGARTGSFTITTNDPAANSTSITLNGASAAPPVATPNVLTFASQPLNTTSAAQTVTVANPADAPDLAVNPGTGNPEFKVSGTTCPVAPGTLSAGRSCTVSVTFAPTGTTGARTATLALANVLSVPLTGTGAPGLASISPSALAFGNQALGTTGSPDNTVTITNGVGAADLAISLVLPQTEFKVASSTCLGTLAGGASCTLKLFFAPTGTTGDRTGTLTVATGLSVSLTGTAITGGPKVSPTALAFGSQTLGTTSAPNVVTVTNGLGAADLAIINVMSLPEFKVAGTTCAATLGAGASCTINVTFAPSGAVGDRTGTLTVATGLSVSLTGTASASVPKVSPNSLAFGNQPLSTTSGIRAVTVTNGLGAPDLTINPVMSLPEFKIASSTCGATLLSGASCVVNVTFAPTGAPGDRSGTLTVATGLSVSITGTASAGAPKVSTTTMAFGNQTLGTTSGGRSVTVTNGVGADDLTIGNVVSSPEYKVTSTTCGTTLVAAASCVVNVTFAPTGAAGARSETLTIANGLTVALTGTAVAGVPKVSPAPLAFGNQTLGTTSGTRAVTVSNGLGAPDLTIAFGTAELVDFKVGTTTCAAPLPAGGSCVVNVTFAPTGTAGPRSESFTVASGLTVLLTGTAMPGAPRLSATALAFGNQTVDTSSAARPVTVTNGLGAADLTLTVGTAQLVEFKVASTTCGPTLAASASCVVNVIFAPTGTAGARAETLTIATGLPVSLTGTALASVPKVSPTAVSFASQTLGTTSAVVPVTVSNGTGATPLPITLSTSVADFKIASTTCVGTLLAGASCVVNVAFAPTGAAGARTGTLTAAAGLSVSLTGTALAGVPKLSVTSLAFGNQALGTTSGARSVTLTNGVGAAGLTISNTVSQPEFKVGNTTCLGTLPAGASCVVNLTFVPTGVAGPRAGILTLASGLTVSLTGTAVAGAPKVSATTLAFGNQTLGTTSGSRPVTVTNGLGATTLAMTLGVSQPEFKIGSTDCGGTLLAGASCVINVTFVPTGIAGARNGTLTVATGLTVSLTGTALAGVPKLSATALAFGNQGLGTVSAVRAVTVTNGLGATNLGIALVMSQPEFKIVSTNCGATLLAGASCIVNVSFAPTGVAGARTGSLAVATGLSVALTGTGL